MARAPPKSCSAALSYLHWQTSCRKKPNCSVATSQPLTLRYLDGCAKLNSEAHASCDGTNSDALSVASPYSEARNARKHRKGSWVFGGMVRPCSPRSRFPRRLKHRQQIIETHKCIHIYIYVHRRVYMYIHIYIYLRTIYICIHYTYHILWKNA